MAKIKSFTSLEQSKRLAEILPIESADMYYISGDECDICFGSGIYEEIADWLSDGTSRPADIPCWSLASLLGVLPEKYTELIKEGGMYRIIIKDSYMTCLFDNPVDACCELIVKLHELKVL